jgi:hypothetical protein
VPPTGAPGVNPLLPAFTASIKSPLGLVFDPGVVATNLALTLLFVFLFGLTSEIFNSTIDEHREEIEAWWQRMLRGPLLIFAPVTKLDAAFDGLTEAGRLGAMAHGMGIVLVIGLVYGLLSPDFGINQQSLILIASLMIGAGFVTYLNYGGKSLLIRRRHNAHSVVRLYGTAVLVAIVCVLATRVIGFHPGIIYGFMASTVILTPVALARRDEARLVLLPAAVLLLVSLVAWLLLIPVDAAGDNPGFGPTLLKAVLTIVFIGGLEGLLFNLLPIRYMDGAKVMAWSRPVWAIAFGLVTFLWWQLLLNRDRAYVDALTQTSVGPVIAALIFFVLTTGAVWTFFRIRDQRRLQEGEA